MNLIQNTYRVINILYQQCWSWTKYQNLCIKAKQGRKNDRHKTVFIFRPVLIKLSFYLEFKIKFKLQFLKVALEATFVTTLCTPDAKLKLAWVSSDLSERREIVEDGKSILSDFQFLPRTLSSKSLKTEETFVRCQRLNPELLPPSRSQSSATHLPLLYLSEQFAKIHTYC